MSLFQPVDGQTMYPQGAPQFQGNQMPQMPQNMPVGDGGMMRPSMPQQGADMPVSDMPPGNFEAPLGQSGIPTYVGNPTLDKYIHMFIGGV